MYQELVQTWADASEKELSNVFEDCSECLWNNRLITLNGEVCIIDISLQKVSSEFKTSLIKMGYFYFGPMLKAIVKPPTTQRSLSNLLRINSVDWTKVFLLPRQVTTESSPHSFQYKILNNILLFKFKIAASPLCSLSYIMNQSSDPHFIGATPLLDLRTWHSSTRIHGPTMILGACNAKTPHFVIINQII